MTAYSGESNDSWGMLAEYDDAMAEVWDRFPRLPEPGVNDALDTFVASKNIDIAALVRLGARLAQPTVLAFAFPGGLKYRAIETGARWNYAGSKFHALKIVRGGAGEADTVIVSESETDAARLTILYPACDVAVLPAGARRFTREFAEQLDGYARVLLALDNDEAGEAGAAKIAEHVGHAVRFAPPAGCKDWSEYDGDTVPPLPEAQPKKTIGRTAGELLRAVPVEPDWIIPGVLASGWTVKIAGREKLGKGTLIFNLLARVERGEATVFGDATSPAKTVILTEEPPESVREKVANAGLAEALIVYGWELASMSWTEKAELLVSLAVDGGYGGIFCDNISRATGVTDEAGVELARAVEELSSRAAKAGLFTIIDHHHRKGAGKLDDMSRGGTALAGACDNNIEMERAGTDWETRARRVSSRGRLAATIWTRTIELSEDGRTYTLLADDDDPQNGQDRHRLEVLREFGDTGATVREFAEAIGRTGSAAGRALRQFVTEGQARIVEGKPKRYIAVEEADEPDI